MPIPRAPDTPHFAGYRVAGLLVTPTRELFCPLLRLDGTLKLGFRQPLIDFLEEEKKEQAAPEGE